MTPRRSRRARGADAAAGAPLTGVEQPATTEQRGETAPGDLAECVALLGTLYPSDAVETDGEHEPIPPREPQGALRRDLVDALASLILADLDRKQGGAS